VQRGCEVPPPLSVLVVEPHIDAADSLAELLNLAGHRVQIVHTGQEALRAAPVDAILMEVRLPDLDGWELARRFLAQGATQKKTLVIVVTTGGSEADHDRGAEVGIDWYFLKPADPALLLEILARFAQRAAHPETGSAG
jgi:DNA-binding response OmpR family regulator